MLHTRQPQRARHARGRSPAGNGSTAGRRALSRARSAVGRSALQWPGPQAQEPGLPPAGSGARAAAPGARQVLQRGGHRVRERRGRRRGELRQPRQQLGGLRAERLQRRRGGVHLHRAGVLRGGLRGVTGSRWPGSVALTAAAAAPELLRQRAQTQQGSPASGADCPHTTCWCKQSQNRAGPLQARLCTLLAVAGHLCGGVRTCTGTGWPPLPASPEVTSPCSKGAAPPPS
jgi:hypothetical protein